MAVSSLDEKGNKAIKKNFVFLANWLVLRSQVLNELKSIGMFNEGFLSVFVIKSLFPCVRDN